MVVLSYSFGKFLSALQKTFCGGAQTVSAVWIPRGQLACVVTQQVRRLLSTQA